MVPDDVQTFIARRFDASDREEALALVQFATLHDGSAAGARLVRCAVVASGASIERLRAEIGQLKRDYRDVIVSGEYVPRDGQLVRVRNLNEPIKDDA